MSDGFYLLESKKAVDSLLIGREQLINMLGDGANGIMDNPGQFGDVTFPYIVYSGSSAIDLSTKTSSGTENFITLTVFSKTGDQEECLTIINEIYAALHRKTVTIQGGRPLFIYYDGESNAFKDDQSELTIYQSGIRFSLKVY